MTATTKISRTGYVILYPGNANIGEADAWYCCYQDGGIRGGQLNTQECAGLVEAGALVEYQPIAFTGAVIYRLVQPAAEVSA